MTQPQRVMGTKRNTVSNTVMQIQTEIDENAQSIHHKHIHTHLMSYFAKFPLFFYTTLICLFTCVSQHLHNKTILSHAHLITTLASLILQCTGTSQNSQGAHTAPSVYNSKTWPVPANVQLASVGISLSMTPELASPKVMTNTQFYCLFNPASWLHYPWSAYSNTQSKLLQPLAKHCLPFRVAQCTSVLQYQNCNTDPVRLHMFS